MPGTAYAQKLTPPNPPEADADFPSSFYRPYEAAARSAMILLEAIRADLIRMSGESSVRAITFRLKSPASIRGKLLRKGLPACAHAALTALGDIAGLRVVLGSVDAVYRFAQLIVSSGMLEITGVNDYIAFPKPSGYRSLHLLTRLTVTLDGQTHMIPVEIQLRTSAMDIWASIEHAVCYKPVVQV